MDISEDIIQAAALYKAAFKENKAELLVSLKNCEIVYVPNMPHSHRTIWIEANLILFYSTSEELVSDYLPVSNLQNGTRRGLYCNIINDDKSIEYHVTEIASGNLQCPYTGKPKFIEIESKTLLRVIDLLAFI